MNVSGVTRRSVHEKDMRERLLMAAEELYAEHGPEGLTVRAIARRAHVTTQPIYTFFGDHNTLLSSMYSRVVEEMNAILDDTDVFSTSNASARNDVWFAVAHQYRAYCKLYPGRFRLIRTAGKEVKLQGAAEFQDKLVQRVLELSIIDESDVELLEPRLRLGISAIHGFIQGEFDGFIPVEHADMLFDELLTRFAVPFASIEIS